MLEPYCLATVTDDDYCVATEVLLFSFLKYNRWFEGDVVVLIDSLSQESRERLSDIYPVRFVELDASTGSRRDDLAARVPSLGDKRMRFLSLEIFRLEEYEKLVYLDGDMFCMGDVRELFERSEPLLASFDGWSYKERLRHVFEEAGLPPLGEAVRYGREYESSFSSGVLALSGELLSVDVYDAIVKLLAQDYDPDEWLRFSDQRILNAYFKGRFTNLNGKYNYRIFLEYYHRYYDQVSFPEARLVHFAGTVKPWKNYRTQDLLDYWPPYLKAIDVWRELYDELKHGDDAEFMAARIMEQQRLHARNRAGEVPVAVDRLF